MEPASLQSIAKDAIVKSIASDHVAANGAESHSERKKTAARLAAQYSDVFPTRLGQ